jgi:ABC-type cobalamin/Fe3+-siderophores transport system ATPase subunit
MSKIIIGIDPDSKAHGVAVYIDGRLSRLECLTLYWFVDALEFYSGNDIEVHIEDTCANNSIFRGGNGVKVQQSIARRLGMVQQSQVELERFIHHKGIKIVKHKISKLWKKDKKQFEKATGWMGQSNEDTRSAAYFGFLGLKK